MKHTVSNELSIDQITALIRAAELILAGEEVEGIDSDDLAAAVARLKRLRSKNTR